MTESGGTGVDWPVFIGVTLILCGFAAYATGRALATTWRPARWAVLYCALLGAAGRFLQWSLFSGVLLSPVAYLVDTAILILIALTAYRITQAGKMVRQYPWLYRRTGPFSWQPIVGARHQDRRPNRRQNSASLEKN